MCFERLIHELTSLPSETPLVEFKHNNYNPEMMGKNISALANSATLYDKTNAYMLWGIDDVTHEIIGTDYDLQTLKKSNEETYEGHSEVGELSFGDKKLIRWSFSTKAAGTYKSARLQYHDPVKNETHIVTENGDAEGTGRVLEINQKADSISDAKKIASERLRQANKREITANITLMGDLRFVGGSNITISGFGAFDGKYVIEKATHSVGGSYTTKLDLRMGGESKKESRKKKSAKKGKSKKASKSSGNLLFTGDNVYYAKKEKLNG